MLRLPVGLQRAIKNGELTKAQLRQLIELEARALGLELTQAIRLAKERRLPKNYIGADLELLVKLLAA